MSETNSRNKGEPDIAVIPFGDVPPIAAKVLAAHLSGYLDLVVEIRPPKKIPPETFCGKRFQYNAATLIQHIETISPKRCRKILALVTVDLFIPLFTHVFGEARQNGRVALVSLFRLGTHTDTSCPPTGRLLERVAKIGLHEVGHLLNLLHCDDDRCLMHFCGNVEKLDRIEVNYCRYCRRTLRRAAIHF